MDSLRKDRRNRLKRIHRYLNVILVIYGLVILILGMWNTAVIRRKLNQLEKEGWHDKVFRYSYIVMVSMTSETTILHPVGRSLGRSVNWWIPI